MHDLTRQVGDRRARQLLLSGELDLEHDRACTGDWSMRSHRTMRCLDEAIRMAEGLRRVRPAGRGDDQAAAR